MTAVLQGDHVVIGHDDMVIQCDAQGLKGVPDVVGDKNIFLGGGGDAAGMVVGQHHGGGAKARASVAIFRRLISLALGLPSLSSRTPRSLSFPSKQARKDISFRAPKK